MWYIVIKNYNYSNKYFFKMCNKFISIFDYDKICRTCLNSSDNMVSICKPEVLNMLNVCTTISIKANDGYPNQICSHCFQKATDSYNFNKLCENSDRILKQCEIEEDEMTWSDRLKLRQEKSDNKLQSQSEIKCENLQKVELEDNSRFTKLEQNNILDNSNDFDNNFSTNDQINSTFDEDDEDDDDYKSLQEIKDDELESRNIFSTKKESESAWKKAILLGSDKCDPTTKTCKICNKVLYNVHSLVRHVETHDVNRKFVTTCPLCYRGFFEKQHLKNHLLRHKGEAKYKCDHCKKPFYELCAMRLHCKRKHADKKVVCQECDKKFFLSQDLDVHMKSHNKEQHVCPDCGKTFRFRFRMRDHQWMHAKERIFHCRQCDKSFKSKQVLQLHYKRVHSGERKREVCNICGKAVVYLKTHLNIHNNEIYNCSECGREFRNKYSLEKHVKRKHRNIDDATLNPYLCNICGKRSENLRMLNRHFLTHTDNRPYKCNVCGKFFKTADRRDNHIKHTHNNVRDYKCSYCSKCFHTKSGLTIHIRVHTGERPYSCKLCGKAFQQRSTLRTHMKVHGLHTKSSLDQITRNIEVNLHKFKPNNANSDNITHNQTVNTSSNVV